jgi:hypothetical protein
VNRPQLRPGTRRSQRVKWISAVCAICALIVVSAATTYAQRRGGGGGGGNLFGGFPLRGGGGSNAPILPNAPYDGKFRFIRLRYGPPIPFQTQRAGWSHDYPEGEEHLMKIMEELTYLAPHTDQSNVMALDDPDLFKFPVAYMSEPGGWYMMSDAEATNFRNYLLKGGFLIVDDFRFQHWENFEEQMHRVLPQAQFFDLDVNSPIFHDAFFMIKDLEHIPNYYDPGAPIFRGVYEDNDPTKRLMVMISYNTDISEFWEWSSTGLKPVDESNEAYKIGVNYLIYGMTH